MVMGLVKMDTKYIIWVHIDERGNLSQIAFVVKFSLVAFIALIYLFIYFVFIFLYFSLILVLDNLGIELFEMHIVDRLIKQVPF